ncbi:HMGS, partial [Symbiodinium necroappetens]
ALGFMLQCPVSMKTVDFPGGDLPAQAKLSHSGRNFTNDPNPMCPWCCADGKAIPYGDFRRSAKWRETVASETPWGSSSPLHDLPGGEDE